jgi:carotenoid 1,2-hydratase
VHCGGPRFDVEVAPGGYAWWYVDALSDDGRHGLTLIAFVGSVFSPYYAWARRRAAPDPMNHCAINVALYGEQANRWAMTERGRSRVKRDAASLTVGPSSMRWDGRVLEMNVDEICAPLPSRIRGRIRLVPSMLRETAYPLDARGRHLWTPYGPVARIDVELSHPRMRWQGAGYWDSNIGTEPLEDGFQFWTWSRANLRSSTVVLYDLRERNAAARNLALRFPPEGEACEITAPAAQALDPTRWRVARSTRSDGGRSAQVRSTLEDAPFYSRSLLQTQLLGESAHAFHESLSLDRFRSRWVQCLLPFRMPRDFRN